MGALCNLACGIRNRYHFPAFAFCQWHWDQPPGICLDVPVTGWAGTQLPFLPRASLRCAKPWCSARRILEAELGPTMTPMTSATPAQPQEAAPLIIDQGQLN